MTLSGAALPREYRFHVLDTVDGTRDVIAHRLVAVDLTGANRNVEVATWETPACVPATVDGYFSASADGTRIAFVATGENARSLGVMLGDTRDRTVRLVRYDPDFHVIAPRLSSDGRRIAYLRVPVVQAGSFITEDGIWTADASAPELAQRVVTQLPPTTTALLSLSPDGRWIAFARRAIGGHVFVVPAIGGDAIDVGPGTWAAWRTWEPRLLVGGMPEPQTSPAVTVFDVTRRTQVSRWQTGDERAVAFVGGWHPTLDRVFYDVGLLQPSQPVTVWTRYADGRALRSVADESFLIDVWWSSDGTRLYALHGGDDSTGGVTDLLTHTGVAKICWRGDINAAPCL